MINRRDFLKSMIPISAILIGCGESEQPERSSCSTGRHYDSLEERCVDGQVLGDNSLNHDEPSNEDEESDTPSYEPDSPAPDAPENTPIIAGDRSSIVKVWPDGRPVELINTNTPGGSYVRLPVWSPDGRKIAFVDSDGIYIISSEGGEQEKIVDFDAFDYDAVGDSDLVFSSFHSDDFPARGLFWDSRGIFFHTTRRYEIVSDWGNNFLNDEIYHINPDGSGLQLVYSTGSESGNDPDYGTENIVKISTTSSDDGTIAYIGPSSSEFWSKSIHLLDRNWSSREVPNTWGNALHDVAISRDGRKIAYRVSSLLYHVISSDGADLQEPSLDTDLMEYSVAQWGNICFSPSGNHLFINGDDPFDGVGAFYVNMWNLSTGNIEQLSRDYRLLKDPNWRRD